MANLVEFILPRKPLSYQAKDAANKQMWRDFVYGRAMAAWGHQRPLPLSERPLRFTLVHLCEQQPPDVNNIVKPIQDVLTSLVYADDLQIQDVSAHMRMVDEDIACDDLPPMLTDAVAAGAECVYVSVARSGELGEELA